MSAQANILASSISRALFLFSRSRVPRVSLSHSRNLFSSLEGELVAGPAPVIQQVYYKTKAKNPFQVQLNKKILSLKTVQDQLELYCSEPSMDVVNRVTLLLNIAKIVGRDKEQLDLLRQIKTESPALGIAYVSLLDSISADISQCSPRGLANVMWSLGNLNEKSHSLVQICEKKIMSCDMRSFTPPHIFQIVKGCGLLGIQKMFVKLQEAILNGEVDISEFEKRALTLILIWFTKSGSGNERLFNHFQTEILSRNLMDYDSHNLAAFVWSFAERTVSCPNKLFDQIENEVLRRGAGSMQNLFVVMLLWSFAKVRMGSKRLFSAFDSELAMRRLQAFDNGQLVQLVWSFAKRGFKDAGLYEAVENEVLQRGMSVFSDHHLVLLLWSFTEAEKYETELVKTVSQEFLQRDVKQLDGSNLSQIAWSLGRARIKIPELFKSIKQVITQCPPLAMSNNEMSALMRGFVEAEEESSELSNRFRNAIIKDIESFSVDDICEVLWCFSEDKGNRSAIFNVVEKEILCRGIESFNSVHRKKIKHCFLTAEEGSEELFEMLNNVDKKQVMSEKNAF